VAAHGLRCAPPVRPRPVSEKEEMMKPGLIPFFRTERIQDKILVEQSLIESEIEFEIDAPRHILANAMYPEHGAWEFYTSSDRVRKAEELVRMLPADNLLLAPQEAPQSSSAQKSWAWFVIVMAAAMIAFIFFEIMKLQSR
jgi:hypothetical protein